eukprot:66665_1
MSHITELCFELTVPYPPQLKGAYFKTPTTSFVIEEVLKDINRIVHNNDHPQVQQYTEALLKYKRIKCWFYLSLLLTLLIAGVWAIYMFLLCNLLPTNMQYCDFTSYIHNIINQIAWPLFLVALITTLSLISCGRGWFRMKSKHIAQQWRISIKRAVHRNIVKRRKKSPQYLFELNYRGIIGFIHVRKGTGRTPTVESSSKDYSFDTKPRKRPQRRNLKIKNIEIESVSGHHDGSQELVHLNAHTPGTATPEEDRMDRRHLTPHIHHDPHLMSPKMVEAYAKQNNAMFNALINAPTDPNVQNLSVHPPPAPCMGPIQRYQMQLGGSQPNLRNTMYHTQPGGGEIRESRSMVDLNGSQPTQYNEADIITQSLPPVIPNPVDIDVFNRPNQNHNHAYGYGQHVHQHHPFD